MRRWSRSVARRFPDAVGSSDVFVTEGRFVTGLGRSHPIENGFAWHHTLGAPYLPGSSVKGMVQAWVKAESAASEAERTRLFGGPGEAGEFCFLDAIPASPVALEADVMTPHYAGWTPANPPGDWSSPVPVPFLATAPGARFLFSVLPRGRSKGSQRDLKRVVGWLTEALAWAGAGAKTAAGYGRFRVDQQATADWAQRMEKREAALRHAGKAHTPEDRWRLEIEGASEAEILDKVRVNIGKGELKDPAEREAFARAVLSTGLPELWRRGGKKERQTRTGKKKLREYARLLEPYVQSGAGSDSG